MSYEIDQECTTVKQTIERQFPDLDADEIEARRQIDDLVERGFLLSDEEGYSFAMPPSRAQARVEEQAKAKAVLAFWDRLDTIMNTDGLDVEMLRQYLSHMWGWWPEIRRDIANRADKHDLLLRAVKARDHKGSLIDSEENPLLDPDDEWVF